MITRRHFLGLMPAGLAMLAPCSSALALEIKETGRMRPHDRSKVLSNAPDTPVEQIPNYRALMRAIVIELGTTAHKRNMQVLVRNAPELLIKESMEGDWEEAREPDQPHLKSGEIFTDYLDAIDGMVIDGLYYGLDKYGVPSDHGPTVPLHKSAEILNKAGKRVLSIEYLKDDKAIAEVRKQAASEKILPFVDQDGDMTLSTLPKGRPYAENPDHIQTLADLRNWLPMMQGSHFADRTAWVNSLRDSTYDLLVVDPFWKGESLTKTDVETLKTKPFGAHRMVFARMPVGLASAKRWYWKKEWQAGQPAFLKQPMPINPNFWMVEYWSDEWKAILAKYFTGLAGLGFDGFMLDAVDGFLPFEEMYPVD